MNKNIEVLAPAGNPEALRAAVFSGADAVYLGGALFSARANAVNFDNEQLAQAVKFARVRGVKVYVTVNTLLKDDELDEVMEYVGFLCSLPVDGILVQDMGLFRLVNDLAPDMPLHCSTQMSVHTPAAAKMLWESGADRIVLAREMSLTEIRCVHDACPVELEAFVHGALCMSVSGQCYFSAMLGSRSGNRGRCAQTCRLPFSTKDGKENVLSLKDMSFIRDIGKLMEAGVCSAKIEGRMKRPEYVAAAVSACRREADGHSVPQELYDNLEAVFSRSGFTDGYLRGKLGSDMFGIRTKEDVTAGSSAVFARLHELYKGELCRVPVNISFELYSGRNAVIKITDDRGNEAREESETIAQAALNKPLTAERLKAQLSKLGATPYFAESIEVETDELSAMPMAQINELRRRAADKLSALREFAEPVEMKAYEPDFDPYTAGKMSYRCVFSSYSQIPTNIDDFGVELVYIPLTEKLDNFVALAQKGINVGADMPRSFFGAEDEVRCKMEELIANGFNIFLCGNLGAVALCRELGAEIHGGFSLNVTNTQSLKTFEGLGVSEAELSLELTLDDAAAIGGSIPRGIMVYGRQALMLVRSCPIGHGKCVNCLGVNSITDRKNVDFPVMCMKGRSFRSIEILNSLPLSLCDRINEVKNCDFGILRFTVENPVEIEGIINDFIRHKKPEYAYTRGLFYRGVQ